MTFADGGSPEAATELQRRLFASQLERVNLIDTLGIAAMAVVVPLALRDDASLTRLIIWSVALLVPVCVWMADRGRSSEGASLVWVWVSAILWAALPWIEPDLAAGTQPAWILLFVVAYGMATDAILVPQTFDTKVNLLVLSYVPSYAVAFVLHSKWVQLGAMTLLGVHLATGVGGWRRIKQALLREQSAAELRALVDPLTSLPSRRAAIEHIQDLRRGGDVHAMIVDVDGFKSVNDHLGHHGGDRVLERLATALTSILGPTWFVARLGGDEFIALNALEPTAEQQQSLTTIELPQEDDDPAHIVQLSIGRTCLPGSEATPDAVIREASVALRQAKREGKARLVAVDEALRENEVAAQSLALGAGRALTAGEIVEWVQPIHRLDDFGLAGVELLARWVKGDGDFVPPAVFVPVLEAQGLGTRLGELMIERGLQTLVRLDGLGHTEAFVAVNLSASHLLRDRLPSWLGARIADARVAPDRLILEITESERLADTGEWQSVVQRIRDQGVGVAVDDLGTGWSSISRTVQGPFSHVKIDSRMLHAIPNGEGDRFAAAIHRFAASTGRIVIAEGIETQAHLESLRASGFTLAQGFLLSRPAPFAMAMADFTAGLTAQDRATDATRASELWPTHVPAVRGRIRRR